MNSYLDSLKCPLIITKYFKPIILEINVKDLEFEPAGLIDMIIATIVLNMFWNNTDLLFINIENKSGFPQYN
jgi:hypothetical protein